MESGDAQRLPASIISHMWVEKNAPWMGQHLRRKLVTIFGRGLESGGGTPPVEPPDGKQGQDVDVLPNKGGTAAMSRGGVPGAPSNKDGNAVALRAPARPRNRGDAGGRKLPPPRVSHV